MDTKKSLFGTEIKHNKNVIQATLILEQPQVVQPSRSTDNYLSKCICYIAPHPPPPPPQRLWLVICGLYQQDFYIILYNSVEFNYLRLMIYHWLDILYISFVLVFKLEIKMNFDM